MTTRPNERKGGNNQITPDAVPYGSTGSCATVKLRTPPAVDGPYTSPTTTSSSSSSSSSSSASSSSGVEGRGMRRMVAENPVVVVGRRGCCMCHVARRLLQGLGVNPALCELGEEAAEFEVAGGDLRRADMLPVVFVGGRLLGGIDRLVAVHITGELVPILKDAGALWL